MRFSRFGDIDIDLSDMKTSIPAIDVQAVERRN
jgi:hypothetical protein